MQNSILFKPDMIRAILGGYKTQTRRIVHLPKWSTGNWEDFGTDGKIAETICETTGCLADVSCPYGYVGDILSVRETWKQQGDKYIYAADYSESDRIALKPWKPSIFMPRAACRLKLKITDIRIQRLQDISEEDAISEGLEAKEGNYRIYKTDWATNDPGISFRSLWESINGKQSWNLNCWVWAISFHKL